MNSKNDFKKSKRKPKHKNFDFSKSFRLKKRFFKSLVTTPKTKNKKIIINDPKNKRFLEKPKKLTLNQHQSFNIRKKKRMILHDNSEFLSIKDREKISFHFGKNILYSKLRI